MASMRYHLAVRRAQWKRHRWIRGWRGGRLSPPATPQNWPACQLGFCGDRDLPEWLRSRDSLRRAGLRPAREILISDSSLAESDRTRLLKTGWADEVLDWKDFLHPGLPDPLVRYAKAHPLGRKLVFLSQWVDSSLPHFYADSDVLFYPAALEQLPMWVKPEMGPRHLLDCAVSLEAGMLRSSDPTTTPLNSGVLAWMNPLDWTDALQRIPEHPGFFSEQTAVHVAFHAAGSEALPQSTCIMRADDQWKGREVPAARDRVLRHYISSIRYLFWLARKP